MARIKEIKMQLRHQEWADMVKDCQSSGKSIDEWCRQNGIKVCTYYKRLQACCTPQHLHFSNETLTRNHKS